MAWLGNHCCKDSTLRCMLPTNPTDKSCRYFTSVFVSLGVFLFGYDQGVMSGIITSVSRLTLRDFANKLLEVGISRITLTNLPELQ